MDWPVLRMSRCLSGDGLSMFLGRDGMAMVAIGLLCCVTRCQDDI